MNRANHPESYSLAGMHASRAHSAYPAWAGEGPDRVARCGNRRSRRKPNRSLTRTAQQQLPGAAGVQGVALDDRVVIEMEAWLKEWADQQQPNPAAKQRQNERRK